MNLTLLSPFFLELTNTSGGLKEANQNLFTPEVMSRENARNVLLLITDGAATKSERHLGYNVDLYEVVSYRYDLKTVSSAFENVSCIIKYQLF